MDSYKRILSKLEQFSRKFYAGRLVKGLILFMTTGVIFFLVVLAIEYFLWLNSLGRFFLFLVFLLVELFLLYRYIVIPLFYLFRLKQGITTKEASLLIGRHFPEVRDKLYNLLDLAEDTHKSDLLIASIEQRSKNLDTVPFIQAIDVSESYKYARYLALPIAIVGLIWLSGNLSSFFGSATRVVNYDMAYEPPAPFAFKLITSNLNVLDNEIFTLKVITEGDVRPESVSLILDGNTYFLQKVGEEYHYTFTPPFKDVDFYFAANDVVSRSYKFNVLRTPRIHDFTMYFEFPSYIDRMPEVVKSTGNAIIPEGTKVRWSIEGQHTENIDLVTKDTLVSFGRREDKFEFTQRVFSDFEYQLKTSNSNVKDYENLAYNFSVIKDAYPTISVSKAVDSINANVSYFVGQASDDYGLTKINFVYYPEGKEDNRKILELKSPTSGLSQFYYTFPSGIELEEGVNYSFYFEAIDNDAIHNGKRTKSSVFSQGILDNNELKYNQLKQQNSIIEGMEKTLDSFKEQEKSLKEISEKQKQQSNVNFNQQQQMKDFLHKQQQQEGLMKKFSGKLKENLSRNDSDERLNKLLQERLERQELEALKNEQLLKELNKVTDKINKEELAKRLEEIGNKQQNSQRGLEQLLELTKRYYVTEKAAQLAEELEKLAKEQESLSYDDEDIDKELSEQEKLNVSFQELSNELKELKKDNSALKKPIEFNNSEKQEEDIKSDQEDALEELNKAKDSQTDDNKEKANKKQKSASEKMTELSESLQKGSSPDGESTMAEDAEMLRQILDNLVIFSFKQESLYDQINEGKSDLVQFSESVKRQQELRSLFEHVDDSLFSLSLRRAELSEFVNEQITAVYYNSDKVLDRLVEGQVYQAASYQQYVLTAANDLAEFLAELLDNMQQSMKAGEGSGNGPDFQLPDIIKGQGELKGKMEGMGKDGERGKENGESGQNGEGNKEGKGQGKGENGEGNSGNQGYKGKGQGNGLGNNGENEGNSLGENELEEIYQIYKGQQFLKDQLEKQLEDMIKADDRRLGEKLIKQMEDFQNDLIENGITQRSITKMNTIDYELLKLKNAELKQGSKVERESSRGRSDFKNAITTKPSVMENFRNEEEILQRQALPLYHKFQFRVKDYFKIDD